jgi:hypothetical protein
MKTRRLSTTRKEAIVMAYVLATKGQLPTNLDKLLTDTREIIAGINAGRAKMASVGNVEEFRALMCKRGRAVVRCTAASMAGLIFRPKENTPSN